MDPKRRSSTLGSGVVLTLALVVALAAGACGSNPAEEGAGSAARRGGRPVSGPIAGLWDVKTVLGREVPADQPPITLDLQPDGHAVGHAGVNTYRALYTLPGPSSIRFLNVSTTKRAGPSQAMRRERHYLDALLVVRNFRQDDTAAGRRLILLDPRGTVLIEAAPGKK